MCEIRKVFRSHKILFHLLLLNFLHNLDEVQFARRFNIFQIKVVILGQDPYHGPRQAHGKCSVAFAIRDETISSIPLTCFKRDDFI